MKGIVLVQHALEQTLAKLISIESVSTNEAGCLEIIDFVRGELESLGLFIESDITTGHPWLIATTQETRMPDTMLYAHLDVVPAPPKLFHLTLRDDNLYGRGVYDMKFAAACYIEFFKTHIEALRHRNIGVMFTTDEEDGGRSVEIILQNGWKPNLVFIPDGGDNWGVEERAKGLYTAEIAAKGKTAHASRPWEGENAIHTILDAVQLLRKKYPSNDSYGPTLAVTNITGGEGTNQIPNSSTAFLDFRSFHKSELSEYTLELEELSRTFNFTIAPLSIGDPLLLDHANPHVQEFVRALEQHINEPVRYTDSFGATDGRHFATYNIPCVIVEPTGGDRHSDNEWLKASDLTSYYELIVRWLLP